MQNRYFGDIGDFGKYGMLRSAIKTGLKLGVNWYLFPNESHNNDGKHKAYLNKDNHNVSICDNELYLNLKNIINHVPDEELSVKLIENSDMLSCAKFYDAILEIEFLQDWKKRQEDRQNWFLKSMCELENCDMVFCDPDNGFEVPSVGHTAKKAGKYIFFKEAKAMYDSGKSLIVYHHGPLWFKNGQVQEYVQAMISMLENNVSKEATIVCLQWQTTAKRFYFWIIRPEHKEKLIGSINQVTSNEWGNHFKIIET
jgi:hypothetical protein